MALGTGSELQRLMACPASAALPRVGHASPWADSGTGMHLFFRNVQKLGRAEALELVPEDLRERAALVDTERLLPPGAAVFGEVALALDVETGAVRLLGFDLERNYEKEGPLGENELAMTLDVVVVTPGHVYAGDFKTGHGRVPPASRNWQVRGGAFVAARWRGVDSATAAVITVPEHGRPLHDEARLDGFDLDTIAADLRLMGQRIRNERELVASKQPPQAFPLRAVTGEHCRYCPSFDFCPAKSALVRQVTREPGAVAKSIMDKLSTGEVAEAYRRWREAKAVMDRLWYVFKERSEAEPIPLGDGYFYGPHETRESVIDPQTAWEVLATQHDPEIARAAMTLETSKAGIERAMDVAKERMVKAGQKISRAELHRRALAAIEKAGGMTVRPKIKVEEYRAEGPSEPAS